ncbi:MAG: YdcF family protein [Acidobacteriota bacterium]|nr:YdcF family protein [Acidobacteriota bacterium]
MTTHALPILKAAVLTGLLLANYVAIPSSNTSLTHFDTLIVLGVPSLADGTPSPEQRERVLEGVREYKAHVSAHLIMTGGAAHNAFVEAHSMKVYAIAQGVPSDAILEEDQAKDTIQNIYFSDKLMQSHDWHSAEVISSPSHLPRTALILAHYKFAWRTHASHWPPEYTQADIVAHFEGEAKGCWTLTHRGFKPNKWLPAS